MGGGPTTTVMLQAFRIPSPLYRLEDRLRPQVQVVQDVLRLAAALGDAVDEDVLQLHVVAALGDGDGDLGVEAAAVVVFHRRDRPAAAGGDRQQLLGVLHRKAVGVDYRGLAAALGQLV